MDEVTDKTTGFHFTIVDNYILNSGGLKALEQIVYIHLKQYADHSSKCFASVSTIADHIDVSTNTVRKMLRSLEEKGYLDIHKRINMSNEYILLPYPEYVEEAEADIQKQTTAPGKESAGTCSEGKDYEKPGCNRTTVTNQASEKTAAGIGLVLQSYQNNINSLYGSMERDKLISWFDTFGCNCDCQVAFSSFHQISFST